jgi:hypothetical protein
MHINKSETGVTLSQTDYINELANDFNVTSKRPISTHMDHKFIIGPLENDSILKNPTPYLHLVGSLLSVARTSRPDILVSVSILTLQMQEPSTRYWEAGLRILQYLYHTRDYALTLNSTSKEPAIVVYTDSSWAGDPSNRRSRSGGVALFDNCYFNGSRIPSNGHWRTGNNTPS